MHAQGVLGRASFKVKLTLVNSALDGWTVDDDEIAIIRVLETAKATNQAEVYQLAAAATWEAIFSSVDGDEYDTLLAILQDPV